MEDGSPANPADNSAPIDQNQNELTTEISAEEEAALVDRVLGVDGPPVVKTFDGLGEPDKPAEPAKPAEGDKPKDPEVAETEEEKTAREAKEAEEAAKPKPPAKADEEEEPAAPEEIPAVDTSDLWIEIEGVVVDDEGNQTPKTFKLTVDGELPDDLKFKNEKQLTEVLDALGEMRQLKRQRESDREAKVAEQEKTQSEQASRQEQFDAWDTEIDTLMEAGLLDRPKIEPGQPGYLEDPAVVKVDEVFKFMATENEKRRADGKKPIRAFSVAFNLMKADSTKADEEAKAKAEAEEAKKRGAMVGGGSSASAGAGKEYVYRSGSAKTIHGVDTSDL